MAPGLDPVLLGLLDPSWIHHAAELPALSSPRSQASSIPPAAASWGDPQHRAALYWVCMLYSRYHQLWSQGAGQSLHPAALSSTLGTGHIPSPPRVGHLLDAVQGRHTILRAAIPPVADPNLDATGPPSLHPPPPCPQLTSSTTEADHVARHHLRRSATSSGLDSSAADVLDCPPASQLDLDHLAPDIGLAVSDCAIVACSTTVPSKTLGTRSIFKTTSTSFSPAGLPKPLNARRRPQTQAISTIVSELLRTGFDFEFGGNRVEGEVDCWCIRPRCLCSPGLPLHGYAGRV